VTTGVAVGDTVGDTVGDIVGEQMYALKSAPPESMLIEARITYCWHLS
jgi:hypothetical protein